MENSNNEVTITLNLSEILELSKLSGQIMGVADSLRRDLIPLSSEKQCLINASKRISELLQSKIETKND